MTSDGPWLSNIKMDASIRWAEGMCYNHSPPIKWHPIVMVSTKKGNSDVCIFTVLNVLKPQSGRGCSPEADSTPYFLIHSYSWQLWVGIHRVRQFMLHPDSTCTNSNYCSTISMGFHSSGLQCCIIGSSIPDVLKDCTTFIFKLLQVWEYVRYGH